jgi:flavorubredoxin
MAKAVAEGLEAEGADVTLHNTDEKRYDIMQFPQVDCVAVGSPDYYSYIAGGLKMFLDDHYIADVRKGVEGLKGKPLALFYSHGGGGRVREPLETLFTKRIGEPVAETVESKGAPLEDVLEKCRALGRKLAKVAKG